MGPKRVANFYNHDKTKWKFINISRYIIINVPESILGFEQINETEYRLVHDKQLLENFGLVKFFSVEDKKFNIHLFNNEVITLDIVSKFNVSSSDKSFFYVEELKYKPGKYKLYCTNDLFNVNNLSTIEIARYD